MYPATYDITYLINLLIMLGINTALTFKLIKTEGFQGSDHWFLVLIFAGELCALQCIHTDRIEKRLWGIANGK